MKAGQSPTVEELFGQLSATAQAQLVAAATVCLKEGTPFALTLEGTTFDGRPLCVRFVGEPERGADGSIVGMHGAVQDITEARQATRETEQLAARLDAAMSSITDALFTVDHDWRFTYLNRQAERLLQRDAPSLLGRVVWEEFPEAVTTPLYDAYHRASAGQVVVEVDELHYAPLDLWIEARAFPSTEGLTVAFRDVGERRKLLAAERNASQRAEQAHRTMQHQATHDPLTGLHNRSEIVTRLDRPGPDGFTVLLIDLDGFRRVNEGLGHAAGNGLLMQAAHLLQSLTRQHDIVARTAGDEFAVLLTGHEPQVAEEVADRILQAFRTPIEVGAQRLYVTASIGISRAYPAEPASTALRNADVALSRAKEHGRDTAVWYDPMAPQRPSEQLTAAADLHDALTSGQLLLHYRPAFDLATGTPLGAEALVRWEHPQRGLISPGLFIPVAEETGLIEPLGAWCLREALATVRDWHGRWPNFTVWVNVAVHQLREPGLARRIARMLTDAGIPPAQLGVEITESAFAQDRTVVLRELETISRLGVQVAIDDFGTGYSSLARLGSLPIDLLKIDRSFVSDLDTTAGAATVAAIVDLAHAIDVEVIAEGVETDEQLRALQRMGCDQASGFLLARPDVASQLVAGCTAGSALIRTPAAVLGWHRFASAASMP